MTLKANEPMSIVMKYLDDFFASQRKSKKGFPKILSVKDRGGSTKTRKELFPDDSDERDPENIPSYVLKE